MPSVFYSWQSDRPNKLCRGFIKKALDAAVAELNADLKEADRPEEGDLSVDHDTKGLPGSPDIASAILENIEVARAFVADVTPIGLSDAAEGVRPKHLPNPNVMIELGYAKSVLKTARIIQIWNTAFTGCVATDLPFDMRGKKGPISYALSDKTPADERKRTFEALRKQLKRAIEAVLATWPSEAPIERWAEHQPDDESIWPNDGGEMLANEPDHGSGTKRVFPPPRSFVRILPARWRGSDDVDRHDGLLEMAGGFSWGATLGGVLTYPGSVLFDDTSKVHAITKRFERTGEVWATRTDIAATYGDVLSIRGDSIPEGWIKYLAYALPHMTSGGGEWPMKVRLGVVGLKGTHWPTDQNRGRPPAALRDKFEMEFTLTSRTVDEVWEHLLNAWTLYRKLFTLPPPSMPTQQPMKLLLTTVIGNSLAA